MVYGEAALYRAGQWAKDEAEVVVAAWDEDRVACFFPGSAYESRITGREGTGCAFAVDPDFAVVRVPFFLYEVVADLVD